jgi:hypothetical protein
VTGQPLHNNISASQIESALEQVRSALGSTQDEDARSALVASLPILESCSAASPLDGSKYHGSIEYTFEDEDYEPFGRAIDVRIYYRWRDYDSADDPHTVWGASIEELEVLAIRYFDKFGNEVERRAPRTDIVAVWGKHR